MLKRVQHDDCYVPHDIGSFSMAIDKFTEKFDRFNLTSKKVYFPTRHPEFISGSIRSEKKN